MPSARPRGILLAAALAAALAPACTGASEPLPPHPARPLPSPPPPASPPPAPAPDAPGGATGTLAPVQSRDQVRLTGYRVEAKSGAWFLESNGHVAVISDEGKLIDFGPTGGRDELSAIDPTVFLATDAAHTEVVRMEPSGEARRVLHVERRILEKPLTLHTWFYFIGATLKIESAVAAATPAGVELAVTIGERVSWGNVPTWAEGPGFVSAGGTFPSDFIARESFGVAYALCSETGRLLPRFSWQDLPGLYESARTGEEMIPVPAQGTSRRRVIELAHATSSLGHAAASLPCLLRSGLDRFASPAGLPPSARIEAARCGSNGRVGSRYARFSPAEREIALPRACFQVRITAPGHTASPWVTPAALASQALPPSGKLQWTVTDPSLQPLPARIVVRGVKSTPDPDWGDDPDQGAALNVVHAERGTGVRELPEGKYQVTIDRGFEYTVAEQEITVTTANTTKVQATLERVVNTQGFIAADLHLHAVPSSDAPQELADRVRALVASGIEVGVATDHNAVTDYGPTIKALGVSSLLASVIGDEVTTKEVFFGHFNVFPLPAGGAPIPWQRTTPNRIFTAARAVGTHGPGTIVQVNHPRMGSIGYFDLLHLDREDLPGFFARAPLADMGFDAIEVFNGDDYARLRNVEECLSDWYALLNGGFRFTATGNSDSHKMTFQEPGVPRNLVALPNDDPAAFDERAFIAAVRGGRVVVSSGPFVQLEAGGKPVGSAIPEGPTEIKVRVDAPPWVEVDRVQLIRRGAVITEWRAPFSPERRGKDKVALHFERQVKETLHKGDWIIAIARGSRPMAALYRRSAQPFGFTNPIWVE
jgi:hypothetical protein